MGINEETIGHQQYNQQETNNGIPKNEVMPSEREMFQMRIEGLREHIFALEKTCADLREDKATLREELNALKAQLVLRQRG